MLDKILSSLFNNSESARGIDQSYKLKNGLHITVTTNKNKTRLEISRDTVYPSDLEWKTVCKNWPYYIGCPEYVKYIDRKGRKALGVNIPSRGYTAEKLL